MASPDSSRPVSRASDASFATATEVTDLPDSPTTAHAPRTVLEQIDHVKALITRLQGPSQSPQGAITAQLFRNRRRSNSHEPVSQVHILSVLDSLKRRVKQEQQLLRRPSEIDPETDSEIDGAIDDRDDELETIREGVEQQRTLKVQREEWLESAEQRVDGLMNERERLADRVVEKEREVDRVEMAKEAVIKERDELRSRLKEKNDEMDKLLEEKKEAEAVRRGHEELKTQHQKLELERDEQEKAAEAQLANTRTEHQTALQALRQENDGQLSALQKEHTDLQAKHDSVLAEHDDRAQETEAQITNLKATHEQTLQALKDVHEKTLASLYADHEMQTTTTKRELAEIMERYDGVLVVRDGAVQELEKLNAEHGRVLNALKDEHGAALDTMTRERDQLTAEKEKLLADRDAAKSESDRLKSGNDESMQSLKDSHVRELDVLRATHATEVREKDETIKKAETHLEDLADGHAKAMQSLRDEYSGQASTLQTEMDELRGRLNALTVANETSSKNAENKLRELSADRDKRIRGLSAEHARQRSSTRKTHEELQEKHNSLLIQHRESTDRATEQQGRIAELERRIQAGEERSTAAETLLKSREEDVSVKDTDLASAQSQVAELQRKTTELSSQLEQRDALLRDTHDSSSTDLMRKLSALETRLERTATDHAQTLSDKEELEYKISQLKSNHEHAISSLEQDQEASLTAALADAAQQMENQLHVQSQAHANEFDKLQESLHGELQNLQIQLEEAAELRQSQMQDADGERKRALGELGGKLTSAEAASAALQARLDAELTSRAEAERSLAELRRQRFEDDKKSAESRDELLHQITSLQVERDALAKRADRARAPSQPDVERALDTDDVSELKRRLAVAEEERDEARRSAGPASTESELARQNEFLASQLETMIAARSAPQTPSANHRDAFVQTEPEEVKPTRSTAQQTAASPSKSRESAQRPVTPKTQPVTQRNDDRAWKTRSFEDYLKQAQSELSELGSVISQNEALFAQKIQEHVGDLQRAKDQLAAEYKDKFDSLLAERAKMEKDVSARSAEEFAKDRQRLVAGYGAYHDEPAQQAAAITKLSTPKRNALRHAEERLVSDYSQRVVKRKSQIAMKHAEDFQSLTLDYDRRLAELLGNRGRLESDLSVDADQFEKDLGELDVMSRQLETERPKKLQSSPNIAEAITGAVEGAQSVRAIQPKSQLPKRTLTSTPRTPTSIPKAVPFPGNRTSLDQSGRRESTDRLSHIKQQSMISSRTPAEELASKRIPSGVRTSRRQSSIARTTIAQDFGVDAVDFERAAPQLEHTVSPEPGRFANFSRRHGSKSFRNSSGIMYNNWGDQRE